MGATTYLVNGTPTELPNTVRTGADLRKYLNVPADRIIMITLSDGSQQQLLDNQNIPANVTEIDTTQPPFVYGSETERGGNSCHTIARKNYA